MSRITRHERGGSGQLEPPRSHFRTLALLRETPHHTTECLHARRLWAPCGVALILTVLQQVGIAEREIVAGRRAQRRYRQQRERRLPDTEVDEVGHVTKLARGRITESS